MKHVFLVWGYSSECRKQLVKGPISCSLDVLNPLQLRQAQQEHGRLRPDACDAPQLVHQELCGVWMAAWGNEYKSELRRTGRPDCHSLRFKPTGSISVCLFASTISNCRIQSLQREPWQSIVAKNNIEWAITVDLTWVIGSEEFKVN